MKTLISKALLIVLTLGLAQGVLAEEVSIHFSGHITNIQDQDNVLNGTGITTDSTFVGIIAYDSDSSPLSSTPPTYAAYSGTLLMITIHNHYHIRASPTGLEVANNMPSDSGYWDGICCEAAGEITTSFPVPIEGIYFDLGASSSQPPGPSALTSIGLPLKLDSNDFQDYRIIEIYGVDNLQISGEIDTFHGQDSDSDGVPDSLDLCPSTPEDMPVKTNGCVEGDYNNDGNIDGADLAEFSDRFGM